MRIRPGQVWRYSVDDKHRDYTIGSVRVSYCALLNGKNEVTNTDYPLSNFDSPLWTLVEDIEEGYYKAKCPECKRVKKIAKDDYLCARCREIRHDA